MQGDRILTAVESSQTTLFEGVSAPSVKKTIRKKYESPDYLELFVTASDIQHIEDFLFRYPMVNAHRMAVLDISKTVPMILTRLLKMLEELPDTSKCVLVSENTVPDTISSRSHVNAVSFLSQSATSAVLRARGYTSEFAEETAHMIHGDISLASKIQNLPDDKIVVLDALTLVLQRSPAALDELATSWQSIHTELLLKACREVITERYRFFTEEELTPLLTKATSLRLISLIKPSTRPRLVVRGGLLPLTV